MDPHNLSNAITGLVALVERLRSPQGCPWDAKQTDSSVRIYLLEEAYEVLEAIEKGSPSEVCQELGDLLFQIVFLSQLGAERREFDLTEVIERITEKMIRRHPHVFGDEEVRSADDVVENWRRIKRMEKGHAARDDSALTAVPKDLPALLRAHRLLERVSQFKVVRETVGDLLEDIRQSVAQMEAANKMGKQESAADQIGHLLFSLAKLSRLWGLNAEHLLRGMNQDFVDRFHRVEMAFRNQGNDIEKATAEEIQKAWTNAKAETS
jgi:tetrapyrrole methylase family protein/MazG family protein